MVMTDDDKRNAAGEIISWKTRNCGKVTVQRFRDALTAEGFDATQVQQSSPKGALKRALRQLGKDKVIKELACDDSDKARFQLTGVIKVGDGNAQELLYDREAIFTLDLNTGGITADKTGQPLVEIAAWYAEALDERTRGDIKRVIQRLFDAEASIFCINPENGGTYFVPEIHRPFLDRVDRMLRDLGGKLARFPVIDGTSEGSESIADAMQHWFDELIKDLDGTVEAWDEATKAGSFKNHAERFQLAATKLDAAAVYLGDRMQHLTARLSQSKQAMAKKIIGTDSTASKTYRATALKDGDGNPVERKAETIVAMMDTKGGRVTTDNESPITIIRTDNENECVVSGGSDDIAIGVIETSVAEFLNRIKAAERAVKKAAKEAKDEASSSGDEVESSGGASPSGASESDGQPLSEDEESAVVSSAVEA